MIASCHMAFGISPKALPMSAKAEKIPLADAFICAVSSGVGGSSGVVRMLTSTEPIDATAPITNAAITMFWNIVRHPPLNNPSDNKTPGVI